MSILSLMSRANAQQHPLSMLGYFNSLEVQMVEGGIAEKFPDEWDLQFLGNTIISHLASGIPPDFLIKRYILSIYSIIKV